MKDHLKKLWWLKFWWVLVIILILPLIDRCLSLFSIQLFQDNALGNLFATLIGVGIGVPVALAIYLHQQEEQDKKEKDKATKEIELKQKQESAEEQETLKAIVERLREELNENMKSIERLQDALTEAKSSDKEIWEWLLAISNSLVSDSYHDLVDFDSKGKLWRDIDVYVRIIAYPLIEGLRKRIRESKEKCSYMMKRGNQESADSELSFIQELAQIAYQRSKEALAELDRFRLQKGYIQSLTQSFNNSIAQH